MAGGTFNHTTKQVEFRLYKWNTRQPFPPRDIITYHPTIDQYSTETPPPPSISTHIDEQIRRSPHDVIFELTQTLQRTDTGELLTIYNPVPTPTHRLPNDPGPLPDTVSRETMLEIDVKSYSCSWESWCGRPKTTLADSDARFNNNKQQLPPKTSKRPQPPPPRTLPLEETSRP